MRKICLLATALISSYFLFAQVSITTDGSTPAPSAMLDIKSTSKGLLIPRIALSGTNDNASVTSPAEGLLIYNTATTGGANAITPGFYYYRLGSWYRLIVDNGGATSPWLLGGNTGTTPASHFIGTTDNVPLLFKVNNTWAGKIDQALLNTFLGMNAGAANPSGVGNTGFGTSSLQVVTSGQRNTGVGAQALNFTMEGSDNTAVGTSALANNINAINNTAIGSGALNANIASNNTAIGYQALFMNSNGTNNTAVGTKSLSKNTAFNNTAIGFESMLDNTTGGANTAVGTNALSSNTIGASNTALGYRALFSNNTGGYNTAVGMFTMTSNTTGNNNTAVGNNALYSNISGTDNVAIGPEALFFNSTTNANTAVGTRALRMNTSVFNTAIGTDALSFNTTGFRNTGIGYFALNANSIGEGNTSIGMFSMKDNTTGYNNTAIGEQSMNANANGVYNTAVGQQSLPGNTSGSNNTAIGRLTLWSNATGSNNTALGYGANVGSTNLVNATAIGSVAQVDCSNCLVLGSVAGVNSAVNDTRVGIGTSNPSSALRINANSTMGGKVQLHLHETANDFSRITMSNTTTVNYWDIAANPNTTNATAVLNFFYSGMGDILSLKGNGNATLTGNMTANGILLTSDERYKRDISLINDALGKVTQLNGYHYYWNGNMNDQSLQAGVIAQEVEKVLPELVKKDDNGLRSVNYSGLIPYLIQSIKEQQEQVTTLKNQNEEFRKQLAELKNVVEKIQSPSR